jgi:hypothetical protein
MPPCQLPGYESHVYTGYQLPYDPHEWDYNSWYDTGRPGTPSAEWYYAASQRQQQRHSYRHVRACGDCAIQQICDGFHSQYVSRWGGSEARPFPGAPTTDPCHFVRNQTKIEYERGADGSDQPDNPAEDTSAALPLRLPNSGGATERREHTTAR